ncbi:MAG TPA: hypothetical protein VEU30_07250 [Thermoanaerobaculia bacterium]|nr:hypothetical protein [Thermoanaerobaculia bacterium]
MINLVLAAIVFPLIGITLLWRRPRRPPAGWVATFILALGVTAFSFFASPWGYLGLPGRYAVAGLFLAALVVSLRRPPDDRADDTPTRMLVKILIGLFFGNVALGVLRAHSVPPNAIDLAFPFATGSRVVIHGGSTPAANTYVGRGAEGFGVDVTAKAGERVVSPCSGTIDASGKLLCGNVAVVMRGVRVDARNAVQRGAQIGQAVEKQVHVHAERNGQPVPVTFDGKWLVRNMVVDRD